MLSVTSAQLDAWLAAYLFPLVRILGLIGVAPVFNNAALPAQIKLALSIGITLAVAPVLPPMPAVSPGSGIGLVVLAQQMLVGVALGFVMRVVFAAIDLAGEIIGLQMGLSFAVFYDPQSAGQTAVVAEFIGLLATLVFLALNGHLLMLDVLAESFRLLPVSASPLAPESWAGLARHGTTLFIAGVLLSLPLIAALLITNIALGVLNRAAPQLNLFAVGFPVTLVVGFGVLALSLSYMAPVFERMFDQGIDAMGVLLQSATPRR